MTNISILSVTGTGYWPFVPLPPFFPLLFGIGTWPWSWPWPNGQLVNKFLSSSVCRFHTSYILYMLIFIRSTYLTLSSCLNFAPLVAYRIRFPFLSIIHIIFFIFFLSFLVVSPHIALLNFFYLFFFFVLSPLLSCMTYYLPTYIPILIILLSMFMSMSMSRSRSRCLHVYHTIPHYTIPYLSLQWHRIWRVR